MKILIYITCSIIMLTHSSVPLVYGSNEGDPTKIIQKVEKLDINKTTAKERDHLIVELEKVIENKSAPSAERVKAGAQLRNLLIIHSNHVVNKRLVGVLEENIALAESPKDIAEAKLRYAQVLLLPSDIEIHESLRISAVLSALEAIGEYESQARQFNKDSVGIADIQQINGRSVVVFPSSDYFYYEKVELVQAFLNYLIATGDYERALDVINNSSGWLFSQDLAHGIKHRSRLIKKKFHCAIGMADYNLALRSMTELRDGSFLEDAEMKGLMNTFIGMVLAQSAESIGLIENSIVENGYSTLVYPIKLEAIKMYYKNGDYQAVSKSARLLYNEINSSNSEYWLDSYFSSKEELAQYKIELLDLLNAGLTKENRFKEAVAVNRMADLIKKINNKESLDE